MASTLVDDPLDRAFDRLYRRYVDDVYRYVLAVLRNPAEAEDVTQTTFMNAYRALRAGEEPQKPQNWLIAIAHNACRSRVRWTMRRPREVPLDAAYGEVTDVDQERPNVSELTRALRRLPANQRSAITMRELEGRSYPEIARSLGVSVPAVESLISRARRTLRVQAAALRGLTIMQLPRSLRRVLQNGEALGGGAAGAGVLAKAAAVAVVVASGVGYVAGDAVPRPAPNISRPQPRPTVVVPARPATAPATAVVPVRRGATLARPATAGAARRAAAPQPHTTTAGHDATPPYGRSAPGSEPGPAAPQAPARQHEQQPAQQQGDVVTTVGQAVTHATSTLPATPTVSVPDTTLPAAPALPPPPAVPPPPALPAPPAPSEPTLPQPPDPPSLPLP